MGLDNLKNEARNCTKESRKIKKPLIEKQRRKRINDSLHELKRLVLEALNRDISLYEKMEKADVLDLTVNYLKSSQCSKYREKSTAGLASYQAGFRECQEHMTRALITDPTINANQKSKIISHIASSRPVVTLNLLQPVQSFGTATPTYTIRPHFTITPPSSPTPSPATRLPLSPVEGAASAAHHTDDKKDRRKLFYCKSVTRSETVWRPWQTSAP